MIQVLEDREFDDAATFVAELNKARLANRQKWIVYQRRVAGMAVAIKTYDHNDLQQFRVDGRDVRSQEYGMNVGAWKAEITGILQRAATRAAA